MYTVPAFRVCTVCRKRKRIKSFGRKGRWYRSWCKKCYCKRQRVYARVAYDKDKKFFVKKASHGKKLIRAFIQSLKHGKACVDCKKKFPHYQLDFDHLYGKVLSLGQAANAGWGKARILAEVAKCEIVCANCHRARTWKRRKFSYTRKKQGK